MSGTPLLLRSAPGYTTASYGIAPILSPASDDDHTTSSARSTSSSSSASRRGSFASQPVRRRRRRRKTSIPGPLSLRDDPLDPDVCQSCDSRGAPRLEDDAEMPSSPADSGSEAVEVDQSNDEDPPDNSRYAQVRASVSAVDDTSLSINTPRMWLLSLLFAVIGSATNLFFSLRYPSVAITPVIAVLLVHPLGLLWDGLLRRASDPEETFVDGTLAQREQAATPASRRTRLRLWLAQGAWNEKEHSCVYISSNVSFGFAFATDVIVEQAKFYKQDVSISYQILLILSTQILGYAFAGLTRRFLVRPGGMIWPGTLMSAAMFSTLHKGEKTAANGWTMTRARFFLIVWMSATSFYFLPGLIMPALSYFNVMTWFAPDNVVVANLFGVSSGLGLFPVTFDWAQIAYIGSPLLTPFWAALNVIGGLVVVMWIMAPVAYYTNLFYSSYMPMLSSAVFDNTGAIYDVGRILTPDFVFDEAAYKAYSRVFLPITYVLSYGLQFAALAALLTHTACWHGRDIWKQWSRSLREVEDTMAYKPVGRRPFARSESTDHDVMNREDVHNRLMKRYEEVPLSWYLVICCLMTAVGVFVVEW
jgi:OPT family small oligopeptide transporter